MSDQWFLFTGENAYELDQEKRRWLRNFAEKHGPENIVEISGKSATASELMNEVSAAPFIADKRLILLDGLPKLEKEEVSETILSIHEKTIVLCIEPKPDKRLSSTKVFLETMNVKNFPVKMGESLLQWLMQLSREYSVNLPTNMALEFVSRIGEDQSILASELRKIASFAGTGATITSEQLDDLVLLSAERVGWQLMDYFTSGNKAKTLVLARMILDKGESPYGLWNRILWMVSQLSLVGAFADSGIANPATIAKDASVPFLTARTLLPFVRQAKKSDISSVCVWFANADVDIKTGLLKSTAESPEELQALIDCGLSRLCALKA